MYNRPKDNLYFYPRPPGGGRQYHSRTGSERLIFLSTPSGWRATCCKNTPTSFKASTFLSTPSGWRATILFCSHSVERSISIHALRVEGDMNGARELEQLCIFLSTPSGWRATYKAQYSVKINDHFYPRPPGGGRQGNAARPARQGDFYPRPPGGGRPRTIMSTARTN